MITLRMTQGIKRAVNKVGVKEYVMEGFLEPGLVSYQDVDGGVCRLDKETIDAMLPSFIGCPVTIDHVEESKEEILNGHDQAVKEKKRGVVTNAWWNADTGKYDCSFTVEGQDAAEAVLNGYSGSCAYNVTETGPGGELHAMKYNETILGGEFEHLALVTNPRYEDCRIKLNGKVRMNSKAGEIKLNYGKLPKGWEVLPTQRRADGSGPKTFGYEIYKDGIKKEGSYDKGFSFNSENEALAQGNQRAHEMSAGWNAKENSQYRGSSDFEAEFAKEKKEHPELPDEEIKKIVLDHARAKERKTKGDRWFDSKANTITLKKNDWSEGLDRNPNVPIAQDMINAERIKKEDPIGWREKIIAKYGSAKGSAIIYEMQNGKVTLKSV